MKVERSVNIDRPVAEVFAFLENFENHVRFVPGLLDFRLVTPIGPGAQAIGTRRAFGRIRRLAYRVTIFIPGSAVGVSARLGPLEGAAEYRVEPLDGGRTRLTMTSDYGATGPFGILGGLLTRMARRDAEVVTANFKRAMEETRS
jgi:carbon monoxide dehydrogenase subunit G